MIRAREHDTRVDRIGAVASSLCAVHCLVCALLPVAFSALGLGFLAGHYAEWAFTAIAIAFAVGALVLGWRRHRSGLLVLGISGLIASRGLEMQSAHHAHHGDAHGTTHDLMDPQSHSREGVEPLDTHEQSELMPEEGAHLAGALNGILAGVLLFCGHLLNIRVYRSYARERCSHDC